MGEREGEGDETVWRGVGDFGEEMAVAQLGRAVAPEGKAGKLGADAGNEVRRAAEEEEVRANGGEAVVVGEEAGGVGVVAPRGGVAGDMGGGAAAAAEDVAAGAGEGEVDR